MSLAAQLSAVSSNAQKTLPPQTYDLFTSSRNDFIASFHPGSAIQVGNTLPPFSMPDALGNEVSSASLLAEGPILLTFYRGEWCPFCNRALCALQQHVPFYNAKGVTLVAVSPELPNTSLSMVEKHALTFPVLSDVGNKLAKELGLLSVQPDGFRANFKARGLDMMERTGSEELGVPVPATLLVDGQGVVREAYVEADYTKRLEPAIALEWIEKLRG
ncbi:hypothetical protein MMC30_008139 [Trapelia coarctata]|nr:hypothetical protein [Trapelia coarctata]